MKKTRLYCDRCDQEGKEVPAAAPVWVRVGGMPRPIRQDACTEHLTQILGTTPIASPNGAAPPKPLSPSTAQKVAWGAKSKVYAAAYQKVLAYVAKHPIFSYDDAQKQSDAGPGVVGVVLRRLMKENHLARLKQGVYMQTGHTIPEPKTPEDAAALALKIIRESPGSRSSYVATKAGVRRQGQWKLTMNILREKGVRTKGTKTATQMFPPKD